MWEDLTGCHRAAAVTCSPWALTLGTLLAGGPVYFCRLCDRGQEQRPGCTEGLRVLGLVQHPSFPPQHPPHGHQQHRAGISRTQRDPGDGNTKPQSPQAPLRHPPCPPLPVAFTRRSSNLLLVWTCCREKKVLSILAGTQSPVSPLCFQAHPSLVFQKHSFDPLHGFHTPLRDRHSPWETLIGNGIWFRPQLCEQRDCAVIRASLSLTLVWLLPFYRQGLHRSDLSIGHLP
jgi:hypothetical protein